MIAKLSIIPYSAIIFSTVKLKAITINKTAIGIAAFVIIGLWITTANAEGGSSNVNKAFWLWLEAYSDDEGNIMDPIDLSELAANSQLQAYNSDDSSNAKTNSTLKENHTVNNLDSETNPQAINASAGNDEVSAQ